MLRELQTFENFIVSDCNEEAYNVCTAFVSEPFGKLVALHGSSSSGKTHLLFATKKAYKDKYPNSRILMATYEEIISEYIEILQRKCASELDVFFEKWFNVDLLILDNMQFLAGKSHTQDVVANWFSRMIQNNKSIMITFDRPIEYYEELFASIYENCTLVKLNDADVQFKKQYLSKLLEKLKFDLPEAVANVMIYDKRIPYYVFFGYVSKVGLLQKQLVRQMTEAELFECLSSYRYK